MRRQRNRSLSLIFRALTLGLAFTMAASTSWASGSAPRGGGKSVSKPKRSGSSSRAPRSATPRSPAGDPAHRTLGKACIYGPKDEVIYRPKGSVCRGDNAPKAPAAPAR